LIYLCLKYFMMQQLIIDNTIKSLRRNNFEVFPVKDEEEAHQVFFNQLLPSIQPKTVSWADSVTMQSTGIMEELKKDKNIVLIKTFGEELSYTQKIYWRKQALLVDLFITGTNALTQKGQLVNLDMIGNRVGGINFGPEHVVLFVGVNKIVENLDAAFERIRNWSAPQNIIQRHPHFRTLCRKTGVCMDCSSPDRICNSWVITEKSYPAGRIKIILINKELGL
ncbi:MAG: lactate utilization protein, partial [Odoribacter sp.]|nr:lactate utilization protein [Odoribacter sp.]